MKYSNRNNTPRGFIWLPVQALKPGMYVMALECDWEETPFALQGVYLRNQRDIQRLGEWTQNALVKIEKSRHGVVHKRDRLTPRLDKTVYAEGQDTDMSATAYWSDISLEGQHGLFARALRAQRA